MNEFPIHRNLEEAIAHVPKDRRDALGYLLYTFRMELTETGPSGDAILGSLIDRGWQMSANPYVVEPVGDNPRHVVISMIHAEPGPLRLDGRVDVRGEHRLEGFLRRY